CARAQAIGTVTPDYW
nr:immunoglobulin heavy chain junction region [Macaca mulatta]MOV49735.1 immunoglobulin heavy chain junction region [Macaca mulatta]MOV49785.1 immunoglobulin heavy chain junction region [Macaca mulatta]MOV49880.1 immunoglobulin heavy chain junction region [Macaca mulatta]MOV50097.1 immunoglobulin heavy chain junction region [Macaca mulatta]